jgi:putative aldouronate transport system permease protein
MRMTGVNSLKRGGGWESVRKKLVKSLPYYVLILLPLAYMLVFRYYPMLGAQIAFKDYKVRLGIWASPWAGMKHFETFFKSANSWLIIKNTLVISLYSLLASFPIPIILAVCLNESNVKWFKKSVQMVTYMPYFISTVVLVSMILQFTDVSSGIVAQVYRLFGAQAPNVMGSVGSFRSLYVWTGVWQTMGYSAIVYLAALSGVPLDLYEAARVDGASKLRKILSIDLPYIAPTIITLFILNAGSILSVGFEKIYLMQNNFNTPVSEVISTYVYKVGILNNSFSFSTAVGLFNSVVNLVMLVLVNAISRKVSDISVL